MLVNLIVIFLILLFGFLYSNGSRQKVDSSSNRKKYIWIISLILILQSGLRNVAVGDDTFQYFQLFEGIKSTSWQSIYEYAFEYYEFDIGKDPGYLAFQKAIQIVTGEYQIFLIIIAILFFSALGNFIYKNTTRLDDAILAFLIYSVLFYSFFSITGIRQTIATAATLYGYELIKRRKLIPFMILILIASTIHKSVLIFVPFYFVSQIKNAKYLYGIILVLFPLFMIYNNDLSNYVKVLGGYEEYDQFEGAGAYTFTAMFLLISIVALWRSEIIIKNNDNAQKYYIAFAIALIFIPLTWINPSTMRIVQYFSIFMLLLVPEIIYSFQTLSENIKKGITTFVIVVMITLFVKANWNKNLDYGFFWEEMKLGENYD